MTHSEHNGWHNYETWCVNLWLDNEQSSQSYWAERAEETLSSKLTRDLSEREKPTEDECRDATSDLAVELKASIEEATPKLEGMFADLLNGALSEVNWREIAEHMIEDAKDNL